MKPAFLFKAALIAVSASAVSACVSILPEQEPAAVYRLTAPSAPERIGEQWTVLRVDSVQAPRGLSGDSIAMSMDGRSIAYMSNARWISPVPAMLQGLVIQTLNSADTHIATTRPDDGVRADYELRVEVREYEAVYDAGPEAAPEVRVRLAARLIATENRSLVATREFSARERAAENRAGPIIDTFNSASVAALRELADWASTSLQEADAEAAAAE